MEISHHLIKLAARDLGYARPSPGVTSGASFSPTLASGMEQLQARSKHALNSFRAGRTSDGDEPAYDPRTKKANLDDTITEVPANLGMMAKAYPVTTATGAIAAAGLGGAAGIGSALLLKHLLDKRYQRREQKTAGLQAIAAGARLAARRCWR